MPELEKSESSIVIGSAVKNEAKEDRGPLILLVTTLILFLIIFILFLLKKALLPWFNLAIMPFLLFGAFALKTLVIKRIYTSDKAFKRVTMIRGRLRVRERAGKRLYYIEGTPITFPAKLENTALLAELCGREVEAQVTLNEGVALVERLETEKGRADED